jgi:hypothetical protein
LRRIKFVRAGRARVKNSEGRKSVGLLFKDEPSSLVLLGVVCLSSATSASLDVKSLRHGRGLNEIHFETEEVVKMRKSLLSKVVLSAALTLCAGAAAQAQGNHRHGHIDRGERRELRGDRREIRGDTREIHGDRRETRTDRRDFRGDVRDYRRDRRDGASQAELRSDRREIRGDRRELRGDHHELRSDRRDRRLDVRDYHRDRRDARRD